MLARTRSSPLSSAIDGKMQSSGGKPPPRPTPVSCSTKK
jgi:hypothetical protein